MMKKSYVIVSYHPDPSKYPHDPTTFSHDRLGKIEIKDTPVAWEHGYFFDIAEKFDENNWSYDKQSITEAYDHLDDSGGKFGKVIKGYRGDGDRWYALCELHGDVLPKLIDSGYAVGASLATSTKNNVDHAFDLSIVKEGRRKDTGVVSKIFSDMNEADEYMRNQFLYNISGRNTTMSGTTQQQAVGQVPVPAQVPVQTQPQAQTQVPSQAPAPVQPQAVEIPQSLIPLTETCKSLGLSDDQTKKIQTTTASLFVNGDSNFNTLQRTHEELNKKHEALKAEHEKTKQEKRDVSLEKEIINSANEFLETLRGLPESQEYAALIPSKIAEHDSPMEKEFKVRTAMNVACSRIKRKATSQEIESFSPSVVVTPKRTVLPNESQNFSGYGNGVTAMQEFLKHQQTQLASFGTN